MAKTVTLTDREGREHAVSSPLLVNQLVYSHGYALPDGLSVDDAIAELAKDDEAPAEPAQPPVAVEAKPRGRKEPAGEQPADGKTD